MAEETMYVPGNPPSYPDSYDYGVFGDGGLPAHAAEALMLGERIAACEDGTKTAEILEYCKNYIKYNQTSIMRRVLASAAYADSRRVDHPTEALYSNYNDPLAILYQPAEQNQLTNSAFAPLAALFHYAFGDGSPVSTDLSKLSFNFGRENLAPVDAILSTTNTGHFDINENIGYDFRQSSFWEWTYLGRVSLNLRGTLSVDDQDNWTFDGKVIGFVDRYDANPDPSRGKMGELLTDVLRSIPAHQDYDIYLSGEHQIKLSGKK